MFAARQGFFFAGGAGTTGAFGLINTSTTYVSARSSIASANYTYQVLTKRGTVSQPISLVVYKIDNNGIIIWQKELAIYYSINSPIIKIDNSENLYITCQLNPSPVSGLPRYPTIISLDTDGNLRWQKSIQTNGTNTQGIINDVVVDNAGQNLIVVGSAGNSGTSVGFYGVFTLNDGTQRQLNGVNATLGFDNVVINSASSSCFITFKDPTSTSVELMHVLRFSLSVVGLGSLLNRIQLGNTSYDTFTQALGITPSNEPIVVCKNNNRWQILKLFTTLGIQSQVRLSLSGTTSQYYGSTYDVSGNIYLMFSTTTYPIYIIKLNSNLEVVWTRTLNDSSNNIIGSARAGISWYNNRLYISGDVDPPTIGSYGASLLYIIPDDGSGIGDNGPFIYGSDTSSVSASSAIQSYADTTTTTTVSGPSYGISTTITSTSYSSYNYNFTIE